MDLFSLNGAVPPDGMVYEWKTFPKESRDMLKLQAFGWSAVPFDRHDGLITEDHDLRHVIRYGLILMERTVDLVIKSRKIDFVHAKELKERVNGILSRKPQGFDPELVTVTVTNNRWPPDPREDEMIFDSKGARTNDKYLERAQEEYRKMFPPENEK